MRLNKIRGHKRRWKNIDQWIEYNQHLDLENLEVYQKEYAKIGVSPWNSISVKDSRTPQPRRHTRQLLLSGLVQIYNSWQETLVQLNQPYYLKIWLFDPHFSQSQVVCAIGEEINYYERLFFQPDEAISFPFNDVSLKNFKWKLRADEDYLFDSDIGESDDYASIEEFDAYKKWFSRQLKKPHRLIDNKYNQGNIDKCYAFRKGNIWLGNK